MARPRSIPKAVEEIKSRDPGACISAYAMRQWVRDGLLSSVKTGKNLLVDLDEVERFLSGGGTAHENS